jgi:cyclic pyranopterin phosphate synthase
MFDKYKRKIHYLRISVTDRCNLRCVYCMPEEGISLKKHSDIMSYESMIELVIVAVKLGIDKIRITGGEPLVRKNIVYFIRQLKNIPGLKELVLTTNGLLLERMAEDLKTTGLDRINISLDTIDPEMYSKITRNGDLSHVLRGIDAVIKSGFKQTKINMVLIPGVNIKEIPRMEAFCKEKGLVLQRINHYSLDSLDSINKQYQAERPLSCHICNRLRLTADGKLKPCLFSDLEYPVDFSNIESSLKRAIENKPRNGTSCTSKQNWQIGG